MSELFEKSIRVLELPRLLEMLEHHAVSAEAKARARRLPPLRNRSHLPPENRITVRRL